MDYWKDKVVLVTGGSAGFGRWLADEFARAGARVAIVARGEAPLRVAEQQLLSLGGDVAGFVADVTDPEQVRRLMGEVLERFGRIDALVNNAGRSSRGRALETTVEHYRELWELNFLGPMLCTREAADALRESGGQVINIGTLACKATTRYLGAYPTSKFPLAAFSQQLRMELEPDGVHVMLVIPGPIARPDAGQRYNEQAKGLPNVAREAGAGVQSKGIQPDKLARRILRVAARRRSAELVIPGFARWIFAFQQLAPRWADRLILWMAGD